MTNTTLPVSLLDSASTFASERTGSAIQRNPSNASVLARAQTGDHQAFTELYSLHKRRVYLICLRMVGNPALAEDLTQDSFLQLYRKISMFRGNSAFSTWLHRLTVNVVLMYLRKKRLCLISLESTMEESPEGRFARTFGTSDLNLSGSVDRLTIERAAATLPNGYRNIFILHDVEGFEHREIATRMKCSIGNSKSQLHKARRRLRDHLSR
jgi:RNA polymerase sigma-70 factor (ECF subfamily)